MSDAVDTHLFGSRTGYTTLAYSGGVTESERGELSVLGFGQTGDPELLRALERVPAAFGKPLQSGRFAVTRVFAGGLDDAGRPTLELRSIILEASRYVTIARSGLEELLRNQSVWSTRAFEQATTVRLPSRSASGRRRPVTALDLQLFDAWVNALNTRGALAVAPDDAEYGSAILALPQVLAVADLPRYRWGVRVLGVGAPVDLCTICGGASRSGRRRIITIKDSTPFKFEYVRFLAEANRQSALDELPAAESVIASEKEIDARCDQTLGRGPLDQPRRRFTLSPQRWGAAAAALFLLVGATVGGLAIIKGGGDDSSQETIPAPQPVEDQPESPSGESPLDAGLVQDIRASEGSETPEQRPGQPTEEPTVIETPAARPEQVEEELPPVASGYEEEQGDTGSGLGALGSWWSRFFSNVRAAQEPPPDDEDNPFNSGGNHLDTQMPDEIAEEHAEPDKEASVANDNPKDPVEDAVNRLEEALAEDRLKDALKNLRSGDQLDDFFKEWFEPFVEDIKTVDSEYDTLKRRAKRSTEDETRMWETRMQDLKDELEEPLRALLSRFEEIWGRLNTEIEDFKTNPRNSPQNKKEADIDALLKRADQLVKYVDLCFDAREVVVKPRYDSVVKARYRDDRQRQNMRKLREELKIDGSQWTKMDKQRDPITRRRELIEDELERKRNQKGGA